MMDEQELCKKRLLDLSRQANRKGIVLFSNFLNLNELNIYHQCEKQFETRSECFGGVPYAERQMAAFLPDVLYYEWKYPITALKLTPVHPRFAEQLGHRDILGAIMKLGVDRGKVGDILVSDECSFLFCEESIASYFMENLDTVRHTAVRLEPAAADSLSIRRELEEKAGIITSNRLDSILACVYKLSRSRTVELIRADKVFVNGKSISNTAHTCRENDIISVRGFGRFIYAGESGETGKGRIKIKYKLYKN